MNAEQHFELVNDSDLRKCLLNNLNYYPFCPNGEYNLLSDAIACGFYWAKTPEGANYWKTLHANLLKIEKCKH